MDDLFHECGSMLEHETLEDDRGNSILAHYCSSCEEYAEIELGNEWNLEDSQEENGVTEVFDDVLPEDAISYEFDNCEHGDAARHEYPARHGDEDNLIMYECIECGNTERANQDW